MIDHRSCIRGDISMPEDSKTLRILNLEDNPLDTELMHATLTEGGVECHFLECRRVPISLPL